MAAYRRLYDSRHLQADCQEPGSALETYARQSSMGYLYLFMVPYNKVDFHFSCVVLCHDTIRYDTRCYFNVRSKADISQLNLPHGTDN